MSCVADMQQQPTQLAPSFWHRHAGVLVGLWAGLPIYVGNKVEVLGSQLTLIAVCDSPLGCHTSGNKTHMLKCVVRATGSLRMAWQAH